MSYSVFVARSAAPSVWRSLSLRPGGETWPGSAGPSGPSGCSTGRGCEGRAEGRGRARGLSGRPGRGWPGDCGLWPWPWRWPTGDKKAGGPAGGTGGQPARKTVRSGEWPVWFRTDLGGAGNFLCPGERNIHVGVEEDSRIDRHLVVAAGQIQGQPEPRWASGAGVLVEGILLVIIRPGPLAVFLALRLNL